MAGKSKAMTVLHPLPEGVTAEKLQPALISFLGPSGPRIRYRLPGGLFVTHQDDPTWLIQFEGRVGENDVFSATAETAAEILRALRDEIIPLEDRRRKMPKRWGVLPARPERRRFDFADGIVIAWSRGRWGIRVRGQGMLTAERLSPANLKALATILAHILREEEDMRTA